MADTYLGQWMHVCGGKDGIDVYFPRASVKFCPYCGLNQGATDEQPVPVGDNYITELLARTRVSLDELLEDRLAEFFNVGDIEHLKQIAEAWEIVYEPLQFERIPDESIGTWTITQTVRIQPRKRD